MFALLECLYIILCYIILYHVTSYHITSHHIVYHILSYHIILYYIILYYIILYYIIFFYVCIWSVVVYGSETCWHSPETSVTKYQHTQHNSLEGQTSYLCRTFNDVQKLGYFNVLCLIFRFCLLVCARLHITVFILLH